MSRRLRHRKMHRCPSCERPYLAKRDAKRCCDPAWVRFHVYSPSDIPEGAVDVINCTTTSDILGWVRAAGNGPQSGGTGSGGGRGAPGS